MVMSVDRAMVFDTMRRMDRWATAREIAREMAGYDDIAIVRKVSKKIRWGREVGIVERTAAFGIEMWAYRIREGVQ